MVQPTIELINNAAAALIAILKRLGYTCALWGDLACYGFGIPRTPKRVEAVIFTPSGPPIENLISQVLQTTKGHFFVSKDKPDTLLYYDHTMRGNSKKICVADISCIDAQATHLIRDAEGLPFVSISYIIYHKLSEWVDQSPPLKKSSKRSLKRAAKVVPVVQDLLRIVNTMDDLDIEPLYPPLWDASRQDVLRFMAEFPGYASAWEKLGLGSAPPVVKPSSSPSEPSEPATIQNCPETLIESEGSEIPPTVDPTHTQMIVMAANYSVRLLHKCGWHSAIFGSLACFLYGNNRAPNDVNILVLLPPGSTVTAEELKQNLLALDPSHFFTTMSKEQVNCSTLRYRITNDSVQTAKTACKVDLLLPGEMNLPNFPPSLIHWDEGLPLIPFSLLLLQKLQAWDDHRRSRDVIEWQRQRTDMEDLDSLTGLSAIVPLKYSQPWSDTTLFSLQFQNLTRQRVIDYCASFPRSAPAWMSLGFEI